MTRAEKLRAARKYDLAIMRLVPAMRAEIRREKNRFIDEQIAMYRRTGRLSNDLTDKHSVNIMGILKRMYRLSIATATRIAPELAPSLKSYFPIEKKRRPLVEDLLGLWYSQYGLKKAHMISGTTASDMRRLMQAAFEAGEPESVVIKQGLLAKGLSAYRAETIARTETSAAASWASKTSIERMSQESGIILKKEWVPISDDRTRDDHAEMADHPAIAMDAQFDVGGESLDRPADPSGSPANVINCRCVLVYVSDF